MNWKIGDVAFLKGGSPRLTITRIGQDGRGLPSVECCWFMAGEKRTDDFPPDALERASE